jgi:hypothetical protein
MNPILPIANVGVLALYLLFIWLGSAIIASYASARKGYGEKAGLASGLLLSLVGALVWLAIPAKDGSDWRVVGPFPWQRAED